MWWVWVLACAVPPVVPAGPSARDRFVADPPARALPAGERHLGGAQWGRPLRFDRPRHVPASAVRPRTPGHPVLVGLEGGRWAIRDREVWTLWDPERGIVAERQGSGWPTPDGAWLTEGHSRGGPVRLDPEPVPDTRTAWIRLGTGAFQATWNEATLSEHGFARPTDKVPGATVLLVLKAGAAVTPADHLAVRDPDGKRRELGGCTDPEAVYFAPGDAALACRGDGRIVVHDRANGTSWSVAEELEKTAGASVSAAGEVVVHVAVDGPCVHHADGRSWALPGLGATRALVTDDGSLVVAVGAGIAVFDAVTGIRLDPPREDLAVSALAMGPDGEIAVIGAGDVLTAWGADDAPLGAWSPDDDPKERRAHSMEGAFRQIEWAGGAVCASPGSGRVTCRDPRDGWRVTVTRKGNGEAVGSHLVNCHPFLVDGVAVPDLICASGQRRVAGDPDHVRVARRDYLRRSREDALALHLATLTVGPARPAAKRVAWISLAGGVHVPGPLGAPEPASLPEPPAPPAPIATSDRRIPLAPAGLPPWTLGSAPRPADVELGRFEVRFRRTDGALARFSAHDAQVAGAGDLLVVRSGSRLHVVSRVDGTAATVRIPSGAGPLAVSPDGAQAAVSGGGVTRVYDLATLREVASGARVVRVAHSPEGRYALARRTDGTVELVDLATSTVTPVAGLLLSQSYSFAFPLVADRDGAAQLAPDGTLLARRSLPWRLDAIGLVLDPQGRVELVAEGRRYATDASGRLTDLGSVVEDPVWSARFPDVRWHIPGRFGVEPLAVACPPSAGLACSAVPAAPREPAGIADLTAPMPSPDGRWVVGRRRDGRSVLRGPDGASELLPKDALVTWADDAMLVVEAPGVREVWRDGVRRGSTPGGRRGGVIAAGGGTVVRGVARTIVASPIDGGPPTCMLPAGEAHVLVVDDQGRFAAWLDADGVWRADLAACEIEARPPAVAQLAPPAREGSSRDRLAALGWEPQAGPLVGSQDHELVGYRAEVAWSPAGAAAWGSPGGVAWWGPGGAPRLCAPPESPAGVGWSHDGGLVAWTGSELLTISAATLGACPPFPASD